MAMVVKNNMSAVRTLNTLNQNSSALSKSLSRVSSGMKINSAQDDAAGYAISERMRVRIRSLDQANQNTQNDSSLMKTAEGAVGNTVELLRALKEKAINAANDSNTDEDRQTIQKELNQFIDQIDDNALVQFNGKYLVDGSKNNAVIDTKTILLNQSLKAGTAATDALTGLANRAGDSLEILSTDKWQVSWVQNGTIHTSSGTVGTKSLDAILKESLATEDADGNVTYAGTAARTSADGVIGTVDADLMSGYTSVPDAPANTSYANASNVSDVSAMLASAQDADGNAINFGAMTAGEEVNAVYYKASEADGTPEAVNITVKADTTDNSTISGYTISGADNLEGVQLYTKLDTSTHYLEVSYDDVLAAAKDAAGFDDTSGGASSFAELGLEYFADSDGTALTDSGATKPGFYQNYNGTTSVLTTTLEKDTDNPGGTGTGRGTYATSTKFYVENPNYVDPSKPVEVPDPDPQDKFEKKVYTPDKTSGIAFVASEAGVGSQISGLTINIMDQDGNVKKAANAALDQFKQYQRAENKTGDMSLNFHIGSEANVAIKVGLGDMRAEALGLKGSTGERILVTTKENANASINVIENALTKALDQQTTIGAIEARLEYTATNLTTSSENVQAAESTIRDADMAKEMTNYTKNNVLLQAAQAMLAQANQNSSAVLSLLQ